MLVECWKVANWNAKTFLFPYFVVLYFPSRALQGIFEVESHDLAIAMFLSRSENKDGEHLDTIPTMAKSTFTTKKMRIDIDKSRAFKFAVATWLFEQMAKLNISLLREAYY